MSGPGPSYHPTKPDTEMFQVLLTAIHQDVPIEQGCQDTKYHSPGIELVISPEGQKHPQEVEVSEMRLTSASKRESTRKSDP